MGILDNLQKLEKRLEKLAERSDVPLEPIEIRRAALDEIDDLVEPAGRSRRVFPYNRITVEVLAAHAKQRATMEAVLGESSDLRTAISERLESSGCRQPHLDVRLKLVKRAGSEWPTGRVFRVLCERVEPETSSSAVPVAAPGRAVGRAHLVVIRGETTRKSYPLTAERTNVGRLAEVVGKDKRVVRRNQVAFSERDDGINQTVSRAHAHLALAPTGEYRLFDDHSSCGTRIFRAGRTISLPSGSPRGTKLQPGDEIYFGQACVRFEVKQG